MFVESLGGVEIYALILTSQWPEEYGLAFYEALMVTKTSGSEEYKRAGRVTLSDGMLGWKPSEQAKEKRPIITLI